MDCSNSSFGLVLQRVSNTAVFAPHNCYSRISATPKSPPFLGPENVRKFEGPLYLVGRTKARSAE